MHTIQLKLITSLIWIMAMTVHAQSPDGTKIYGDPLDGRYLLTYTPEGVVPSHSQTAFQKGTGNCYYRSLSVPGSLVIPLQLPDDHRIQGIRYEYIDQVVNSSEYVEMSLYTFDHFGLFVNEVTVQSSGYLGLDSQFVAITPAIEVNNALYSYAIELTDSGNFPVNTDLQHCSVSLSMSSVPAP